jgi:hypothetical protein
VIGNATAAKVAAAIIHHARTPQDAVDIVQALGAIPGNKSYRDSVARVLYFVQHAPRELHDSPLDMSQRSVDIHEEELGSA